MIETSRTKVVISNFWHNPGIEITVMHHEKKAPKGAIFVEMDFKDFLQALALEMCHPLRIFTKNRLRTAIESAARSVIEKAKLASTEGIR